MAQPKLAEVHHVRPQWRSQMGFILAALGSAIGLGNIWRFSYLCYKNGGGAFLIPYFIALLIVGIPLMILELGIGHKMRGSAPMSFAKISRKWEWVGWWSVNIAMYGIMIYYSVVIAWCVSYLFFSFNLSWGSDPNNFFFNEFLKVSSGPFEFGDPRGGIVFSLLGVWLLCWFIVYSGIQKGVERANKIFMPLLLILILILVFWSWGLNGAEIGRAVYLQPNFNLLKNPQVWIDAFSQIFFTLSLAFGIMITYASYLPRKVNIVKDALIITLGNSAFSIISGLAVFSTLGYMAHAQGVPIDEVVTKGIGLAFVAYPKAISMMPNFARGFGVIFFASLVIAGLSSGISLVEAFSSAVMDKFNYSRKAVVSAVCISSFVLSIIFALQSGIFWVDILDQFITHYGLVIIGILECLLIGWVFKAKKIREHINLASEQKTLSVIWDVCVKFITPLILGILLINDLIAEIKAPYEGYSRVANILIGRDWIIYALFAALIISGRRWIKELVIGKEVK